MVTSYPVAANDTVVGEGGVQRERPDSHNACYPLKELRPDSESWLSKANFASIDLLTSAVVPSRAFTLLRPLSGTRRVRVAGETNR